MVDESMIKFFLLVLKVEIQSHQRKIKRVHLLHIPNPKCVKGTYVYMILSIYDI